MSSGFYGTPGKKDAASTRESTPRTPHVDSNGTSNNSASPAPVRPSSLSGARQGTTGSWGRIQLDVEGEQDRPAPPQRSGSEIKFAFVRAVRGLMFGQSGRSKRMLREHWRPLNLRIVTPETQFTRENTNSGSFSSRTGTRWQITRETVRQLRTRDAHVRIPPRIGEWLTQEENIAMDPDGDPAPKLLYAAKISQRYKDRVIADAPCCVAFACPFPLMGLLYLLTYYRLYISCVCPAAFIHADQTLLWRKKHYHKRHYLYVYDNRIEANYPRLRFPWGLLGCGSWNEDHVLVHHFDRGSFGFRQVPCATPFHCCFIWEPFGEVAGRQRCPCNGPLVDKEGVHCNQWGCDHWCCSICCCHFQYPGLEDAAEFAAAADVALQAYFDREKLTKELFDERLDQELIRRGLPKRHAYENKEADDKWAYSKTKSIIVVTVGLFTVLLQIVAVIGGAFYLRFYLNRDQYISFADSLTSNPTRAIESFTG